MDLRARLALLVCAQSLWIGQDSAQGSVLNQALSRATGERVYEAKISPDSAHVVYRTVGLDDPGLFSVPIGGGTAMRLGPSGRFAIGSDSRWVVLEHGGFLHGVSMDGTAEPRPLHPMQAPLHTSIEFRIAPDGRWVVFELGGIHRVPIDGSAEPVLLAAAGRDSEIAPDGSHVVYLLENQSGEQELFSVPFRSGGPVRLNAPLVAGGDVRGFVLAGDSRHVVYSADQEHDERVELYSVPLEGGASAVNLSGPPLNDTRDVITWSVSHDGTRVAFLADRVAPGRFGLYSVPVDRSAEPLELNPTLLASQDVVELAFSPDDRWIVYRLELQLLTGTQHEIWAVPSAGAAPARRLHPELALEANTRSFAIDPLSKRVVFLADLDGDGRRYRLYSASLERAGVPLELDGPEVAPLPANVGITADGRRVLSMTFAPVDLYSVALDGSTPAGLLTGAPLDGDDFFFRYELSRDGKHVVVLGSEGWDFEQSAFSIRVDGSAPPVRLNGALRLGPSTGDVGEYQIAPDGQHVLFHSDSPADDETRDEVYSALADGSRPPVRLHPTPSVDVEDARLSALSPDGRWTVFLATAFEDEPFFPVLSSVDGAAEPVFLGHGIRDLVFTPASDALVYELVSDDGLRGICTRPLFGPEIELTDGIPGQIHALAVTPDSSTAVYVAPQLVADDHELFTVPLDGSAPPRRLNEPPVPGGDVLAARVTGDGRHVVYSADLHQPDVIELFSSKLEGPPASLRVSGALAQGGDVYSWQLAPGGLHALYVADQDADEVVELYSAPVTGGSAPVKLSGALVPGGDVLVPTSGRPELGRAPMLEPTADGTRVVFLADREVDERFDLYVAPMDGSSAPVRLDADLETATYESPYLPSFALASDSARVVFRARIAAGMPHELYVAPLDASSAPRRLNPALVDGGEVRQDFVLSPDGKRVAYTADQAKDERFELFAVSLDDASCERLNGPLVSEGDVRFQSVQFHPDSRRVYYVADQRVDDEFELFLSWAGAPQRRAGTPKSRD